MCVLFSFMFVIFFVSLEMSLFSEYFFVPLPFCLEWGGYAIRFPLADGVFLLCDHWLDFSDQLM